MEKVAESNTNPNLAQTQELAKQLALQIKDKEDHTRAEYVAVVYRDGTNLKTTPLYTKADPFAAPLGEAIKAAGGADNVLAVVHNHTRENAKLSTAPEATLKRDELPSSRPHSKSRPGDWDTAKDLFGDRGDVTYYLLDPQDKLRRYDYADREAWIRESRPTSAIETARGGKTYHPAPAIDLQRDPSVQMPTEPLATPTPSDPHAAKLQAEARSAVAALESGLGIAWNPNSERVAACVGRVAHERGFDGIVSVGLNRAGDDRQAGQSLCVQGRSANPDPYANRATISTHEAANTPVEESMRRIETAQAPAQERAAQDAAQRPPAPSR
ncbi:hypothetical protein PRJ39_18035 [Lysobacter enzymogenes]|uniref:XVIPCD domain-containing protein n=1 Tax=Lysobacter enzymogenes TaxID=69 RepID=UPI003748F4F8